MRVTIIETKLMGHWPQVNALMKIYASRPENSIQLILTKPIAEVVSPLVTQPNIQTTIVGDSPEEVKAALQEFDADRVHINTFEYDPENFLDLIDHRTIITVHNLDECFPKMFSSYGSFKWANIWNIIKGHPRWELLKRPWHYIGLASATVKGRLACIRKVIGAGGKLLVLSHHVRDHLLSYESELQVLVAPFSIYEGAGDMSASNTKIHVCIPGSVSSVRRDYNGLLDILGEKRAEPLRSRLMIDLLGLIDRHSDGEAILKRILALRERGWDIRYFDEFVNAEEGDKELAKSDIILGNLTMLPGKLRYSYTKESGIPYAMLRSAKPGILPRDCRNIRGLESSTMYYDDDNGLLELLHRLVDEPELLQDLKRKAAANAQEYTADKLYSQLS